MKKFSEMSLMDKASFMMIIILVAMVSFACLTIYKQYRYQQQLIADQKFIETLKQENQRKLDEYKKANPDTSIHSLEDINKTDRK